MQAGIVVCNEVEKGRKMTPLLSGTCPYKLVGGKGQAAAGVAENKGHLRSRRCEPPERPRRGAVLRALLAAARPERRRPERSAERAEAVAAAGEAMLAAGRRVACALSGGVDSAVAALLLRRRGAGGGGWARPGATLRRRCGHHASSAQPPPGPSARLSGVGNSPPSLLREGGTAPPRVGPLPEGTSGRGSRSER